MSLVRHVGVVVSDLDKALGFYQDLLGLKLIRRMDEEGPFLDAILGMTGVKVTTAKLAASGDLAQVELLVFAKPRPELGPAPHLTRRGPTHVAFTVTEIDSLYQRMLAAGIVFNAPPQLSADGKAKVTFCRDPDGTFLELVELQP